MEASLEQAGTGTIPFYSFTIIFMTTTNVIINYILITRPSMNEKYIFTISITFAKIVFALLVLPLVISRLAADDVTLDAPCHVTTCFVVGVIAQSMLSTAIRRFLALSERFRYANFTYEGKIKNVVMIWVASLAVAIPYGFNSGINGVFSLTGRNIPISDTVNNEQGNTSQQVYSDNAVSGTPNVSLVNKSDPSQESSNSNEAFFIYNICIFSLQLVIPCVCALLLQAITLYRIKQRPNQRNWVKEVKICQQHICTAAVFLVAWSPLCAANIASNVRHTNYLLLSILQPVAVSCLWTFPFVYFWLNEHMKHEFLLWVVNVKQATICWRQQQNNTAADCS